MGVPSANYVPKKNEFLANVVQKIGRQEFSSKAFINPLARFKKGFISGANEIEEIYVARATSLARDYEGADTLKRVKPDVKTLYHTQNYEKTYTVSVSDQQVRRAFTSQGGVSKLANEIIGSMATGYEYDEYLAMKENFEDFAKLESVPTRVITEVTDQATAKAFVKQLKKDIKLMQFRSKNFCEYETSTKIDEMVLLIDSNYMVEIELEMLASAFNKSVADIETMIIEVDGFATTGLKALLIDEGAIKVFDTLYNVETQRNAKGMFTNHHLNVDKIISMSPMYNGVAYGTQEINSLNVKSKK